MSEGQDERLDREIDRILSGDADAESQAWGVSGRVAREFARLVTEESPRLTPGGRARGWARLQAAAAVKRRRQPLAWIGRVPRWAQMVAVAVLVVLLANGVSAVAADSLPGSPLYAFKRFGEGGQLLLQSTNADRARLWMNLANRRLDEIARLAARGGRVESTAFDAVDESILRALSEIAGTRGSDRVALLQELTLLAVRQQQILDSLALTAAPDQRPRYEQTAKLLAGVASFATSAQTGKPDEDLPPFGLKTPSPTPARTEVTPVTPSPAPTATSVPEAANEQADVPTVAGSGAAPNSDDRPIGSAQASRTPPDATARPVVTEQAEPADDAVPTGSPEPGDDAGTGEDLQPTRAPRATDRPDPTDQPDATDEPAPTEQPDATEQPAATDQPEPTKQTEPTDQPQPTGQPDPTKQPEPTDQPDPTDYPDATHQPEPTDQSDASKTPRPTRTPDASSAARYLVYRA